MSLKVECEECGNFRKIFRQALPILINYRGIILHIPELIVVLASSRP